MSFRIDVISLEGPIFTKTAKGGYNHMEVAYKKDGRVEGKKILDFVNKSIFEQVKKMGVGKSYDIESAKDERDFWQWIGITEASSEAPAAPEVGGQTAAPPSVPSSRPASGRVVGSNYETPEERARRQVLIVRQSSLTAALTILTHNAAKQQINVGDVMSVAQAFVDFVFEGPNTKPQVGTEALKQMVDDIPL